MRDDPGENSEPLQILVVEDSDADAILLREAFEMIDESVGLTFVPDGETAMDILNREEEYADVPLPDIVILDLGLPGMAGEEVLERVKTSQHLRRIPVIVLTDATQDRVVSKVYQKHANAFVSKCDDLDALVEMADNVTGFWGRVVTLPSKSYAR